MNILVPVTAADMDKEYADWITKTAYKFEARLTLFNVQHSLETSTYSFPGFAGYPQPTTAEHDEAALKSAEQIAEDAAKIFQGRGLQTESKGALGESAEAIMAELEDGGYDMIIMKARDRSAPGRFLLGSITDKILHHSRVPVLILK